MPLLEDVKDEEYTALGELILVVRRALSMQVKRRRSSATGKHFPY